MNNSYISMYLPNLLDFKIKLLPHYIKFPLYKTKPKLFLVGSHVYSNIINHNYLIQTSIRWITFYYFNNIFLSLFRYACTNLIIFYLL